jgi:putative membrane protein insertion efficiency factor
MSSRLWKPALWGGLSISLILLFQTSFPLRAEIGAITFYRQHISPVTGRFVTCRYEPTCSTYALMALEESGFWKGNLKIAGRLFMCSPAGLLFDR